jgi:large subunit ribosomal protein L29
MKKREFEQLKTKPAEELNKNLKEYRDKFWSLKTDLAAGKVKNVKEIKHVKKIIAKLLTLINQKHG